MTRTASRAEHELWRTSVTEMVRIFRDALAAVAPILERAHIYSDGNRAYDDWDDVVEALFKSIVERSIQSSGGDGEHVELGRYATVHALYEGQPSIVVEDRNVPTERHIFHSLVSADRLFDSVKVLRLGSPEASADQDVLIPFDRALFFLRLPGAEEDIETLTIDL